MAILQIKLLQRRLSKKSIHLLLMAKKTYFNTAFTHKDSIYLNSLDNVYILTLHMVYTVFCDHFLQEIISLLSSLGVNLLVVFNLISFQMLIYIYILIQP